MASIEFDDNTRDRLRRAVREIGAMISRLIGTAIAIALVFSVGLWSSRMMIARGYEVATETYGPWRHWHLEGRPEADPYTHAHLANSGILRIASNSAGIFEARSDSTGASLHSSCDYIVEGPNLGQLWWSIAVFDADGALIANDADRYTFTSDTAALNPDGSFIITLGRDARSGNWLPTGGAGRLALTFTILDPSTGLSDEQRAERNALLPVIRREGCS